MIWLERLWALFLLWISKREDKNKEVEEVEEVKIEDYRMKKITNKRPWLTNVQAFLDKYSGPAIQMEEEWGLPAEAILAQLALESGWGKSVLRLYPEGEHGTTLVNSLNAFNIKASRSWDGAVGTRSVWEDDNKDGYRQDNEYKLERFRMYDSYDEAFNDYAKLIVNSERYEPAVEAAEEGDAELYVQELQNCGYATDGRYAEKMIKIMRKNFLVEIVDE